jgi:hypothetical protein
VDNWDTYTFTITTAPSNPTKVGGTTVRDMTAMRHENVHVCTTSESAAWIVVSDLYSTLSCPNLVAITLRP